MKTYLLNIWDTWRSSYWFVPTLCAVGAVLLSLTVPLLDGAIAKSDWSLPEWIRTTTATARATLSAMAGAMVAVTGTVFSITIVTLSLTSQQFGPRLLRRFMYDLPTQITLGIRRSPRQDVECAIEELVEIAVRALSPGINDPFTAMNCIDRLGAGLGRLSERKLPTTYRCDDEGRLRIIVRTVSFANAVDAAFNQIRQYGHNSVAVTIRLLEALASVADHVQRDEDRDVLKLHAEMVSRHTESFLKEHDKEEVLERLQRVHRLLGHVGIARPSKQKDVNGLSSD